MSAEQWEYILSQPEMLPYEILIGVMLVGAIVACCQPKLWKWLYQFILVGVIFVASLVIFIYHYVNYTGWQDFVATFGALMCIVASILIGLFSFLFRKHKKKQEAQAAARKKHKRAGYYKGRKK